ncbi:Phosphoribosylformylglycinamidine synthase subunit PurQ [bioreactor metagenome]|uniref:Phosphoribosylformylglycinamidine synthase subunit PurQ n=1 Tax=bioreactor metagenome TaxID=1076179 RepID=A0A644YA93_9ZZZZ
MKTAVVIFPGSNCDQDVIHAVRDTVGSEVNAVWHREEQLPEGTGLVILPGGFSYGDYLRSGAMAARSPIMGAVKEHAGQGGLVLGICNGFQILTESSLLPGVLLPNKTLSFICRPCFLSVENTDTPFTGLFEKGQVVQFPIAHGDGLFFLPADELNDLENRGGAVFRYVSPGGVGGDEWNPNGSVNSIAGIVNPQGNILGLMPHPERASEAILGGEDGRLFWRSVASFLEKGGRRHGLL